MNIIIPDIDDGRILRHVKFYGYRLLTWNTNRRCATGQRKLGYAFYNKEDNLIFSGESYGCAPMKCIDSNDSLRGLIGFFTLRKGDTDEEYFENYTKEQLDFAENEAEDLWMWEIEEGDFEAGEIIPKFTNI